MRFDVFKLVYKTSKEIMDDEAVKYIYRLVYKDGLGNKLNVRGDEEDWRDIEIGEPLLWDRVIRQTNLK